MTTQTTAGAPGRAKGAAVNGSKVFAKVAAFGVFVGAASAASLQAAHADVSADDPLAGSDTAIILGGTTEPMPSTAFAQAAENLYLNPLGFDGGATSSTVCDMIDRPVQRAAAGADDTRTDPTGPE
jgi:hypothetical protein